MYGVSIKNVEKKSMQRKQQMGELKIDKEAKYKWKLELCEKKK